MKTRAARGEHETRKLSGGELLHLVKDPRGKWEIRYYECRHCARGGVFGYLEGLPKSWEGLEFTSAEDAATFVQSEISQQRVLGNF